jgi:hypothetical protein
MKRKLTQDTSLCDYFIEERAQLGRDIYAFVPVRPLAELIAAYAVDSVMAIFYDTSATYILTTREVTFVARAHKPPFVRAPTPFKRDELVPMQSVDVLWLGDALFHFCKNGSDKSRVVAALRAGVPGVPAHVETFATFTDSDVSVCFGSHKRIYPAENVANASFYGDHLYTLSSSGDVHTRRIGIDTIIRNGKWILAKSGVVQMAFSDDYAMFLTRDGNAVCGQGIIPNVAKMFGQGRARLLICKDGTMLYSGIGEGVATDFTPLV